jgi:exodeoxyribonuclease V alpha subunit
MIILPPNLDALFARLAKSKFRSSFGLKTKEFVYLQDKGLEIIKNHAYDFIEKRLGPVYPENDGKQTPMRNHPVFVAQHATGTCCRKCLEKWHKIPKGKKLEAAEIDYVVSVIMRWLEMHNSLDR